MSLYVPSGNQTRIIDNSIQAYHQVLQVNQNRPLDPITEQMVKANDARVEVMDRFDSGAICKWWEKEKRLYNATFLGEIMDWWCGWGKYHPENEKKAEVTPKSEQKRAQQIYNCPNIDDHSLIREYLNTSYEVHSYPNRSCSLLNQELYWTELYQSISRPLSSKDIICQISECIKERLSACYPICLPCVNATEAEKNNMLNYSHNLFFKSDFDENLYWGYFVDTSSQYFVDTSSQLNGWKINQIYTLFNATIQECQQKVRLQTYALYSLLIIPVAVAGGVIYVVCKRKKGNLHFEPLESAEDNA